MVEYQLARQEAGTRRLERQKLAVGEPGARLAAEDDASAQAR